jgi:hypothetical protein
VACQVACSNKEVILILLRAKRMQLRILYKHSSVHCTKTKKAAGVTGKIWKARRCRCRYSPTITHRQNPPGRENKQTRHNLPWKDVPPARQSRHRLLRVLPLLRARPRLCHLPFPKGQTEQIEFPQIEQIEQGQKIGQSHYRMLRSFKCTHMLSQVFGLMPSLRPSMLARLTLTASAHTRLLFRAAAPTRSYRSLR